MTIDERHQRLHPRLEEVLGRDEARTLIEGPGGMSTEHELLRRYIQLLEARMDARLAALETRLLDRTNDQTKTLFRTFVVTNAGMVLAVATLAFGAARLA